MRDSRGRRIAQRQVPKLLSLVLFSYKPIQQVSFFELAVIILFLKFSGADLSVFFLFAEQAEAPGQVLDVEELNFSINDRAVYKFHYSFKDPWGFVHEDYSYVTRPGQRWTGDKVVVRFPAQFPEYSTLSFGDRSIFGYWDYLFLLAGLAIFAISLPSTLRNLKLLKHGRTGVATLLRKERTNTTINDQPVIKLVFNYKDDSGESHEFVIKTHKPRELTDDEQEKILFMPDRASQVVLLDSLPKSLEIHQDKIEFDVEASKRFLLAPGLTLAALIVSLLPVA